MSTSARDQRHVHDRVTFADAALASANRNASANHTAFKSDGAHDIQVDLDITAANGTLVLSVETSLDGGTTWYQVGAFSSKNSITTDKKLFAPLGPDVRLVSTITGDMTYSVSVKAKLA